MTRDPRQDPRKGDVVQIVRQLRVDHVKDGQVYYAAFYDGDDLSYELERIPLAAWRRGCKGGRVLGVPVDGED